MIRVYGANLRSTLVSAHANQGSDLAYKISQRLAWEIGDFVAEVYGREAAISILYRAADALVSSDRTGAIVALSNVQPPADDGAPRGDGSPPASEGEVA